MGNISSMESLLLKQANRFFHQNQDLIDNLKILIGDDIEIPNIGITFNNKLVEIFSKFSNHKVSFEQSELRIIIYSQLTKIIDDAILYLKQYTLSLEKIMHLKKKLPTNESFIGKILYSHFYEEVDELIIQCEEFLNLYQEKDQELFHYDIGSSLPNYVLIHPEVLDEVLEKINHSLTKEEILHNCNIDLRELGYQEKIELEDIIDDDILLDKYFNSINLNFDIYDLVNQKIEVAKEQFQDYPFIKHAVIEFLLDYLEKAITVYKENDWDTYSIIRDKVKQFQLNDYFVEVIGKRIGFCQYLNSIDLEIDSSDYEQELLRLGYQEENSIIFREASEKKYFQYGKEQVERLLESQNSQDSITYTKQKED